MRETVCDCGHISMWRSAKWVAQAQKWFWRYADNYAEKRGKRGRTADMGAERSGAWGRMNTGMRKGAGGGTRTHKPVRAAVFETAAYTIPPHRPADTPVTRGTPFATALYPTSAPSGKLCANQSTDLLIYQFRQWRLVSSIQAAQTKNDKSYTIRCQPSSTSWRAIQTGRGHSPDGLSRGSAWRIHMSIQPRL